MNEITQYTEYLFRAALTKTGDLDTAEELTQETLLAYLASKREISEPKAWLLSVMYRKFSDMLRKKYRLPTISIDLVPEVDEPIDEIAPERPSDGEVRAEVAYLAAKYREVIVKHYLLGEKVEKIAAELGIPKGTVLSRLSAGREQMRKGFEKMREYDSQSYSPMRLDVSCHGTPGLAGEPWSVAAGDLMKQNILIAAYREPLTAVELARTLGIPTAYIENSTGELVKSELMAKVGNRYFTDFMIVTPDELNHRCEVELEFVRENYGLLHECVRNFLAELRLVDFYREIPTEKRARLEYYFVLHLFSTGLYTLLRRLVPSDESFPERPNGGHWLADGLAYPQNYDFAGSKFSRYTYGGERRARFEQTLGAMEFELRVYDSQPELNRYEHGPVELGDDELAKLLYLLSRGIPPETVGFNLMYLQNLPHLESCGILKDREVALPMLTPDEYRELDRVRAAYAKHLADTLETPLRGILPELALELPAQLVGRVAEFRRYSCFGIPMAYVELASERGDIAKTKAPMVFVVDDCNSVR